MPIVDCHRAVSIPVSFILPPQPRLSSSLTKAGSGLPVDKMWKVLDDVAAPTSLASRTPCITPCLSHLRAFCTWCSLSGSSNLGFMWHVLFYSSVPKHQHLSLLVNWQEPWTLECSRRVEQLVGFNSPPFCPMERVRSVPSAFLWHQFGFFVCLFVLFLLNFYYEIITYS